MPTSLPSNRQYRQIFTIKMPFCLAEIYLPTHCFATERLLGRGLENVVAEIKDGQITGYFNENDIQAVGQLGAHKFQDPDFFENFKIAGREASQALWNNCDTLEKLDLKSLENAHLKEEYLKQIELIREVYGYFNLSSPAISAGLERAIDDYFNKFSDKNELIREIKFLMLTGSESTLLDTEEVELSLLVNKIKENKNLVALILEKTSQEIIEKLPTDFPELYKQMVVHQKQYGFLQGYVNFQKFSLEYYLYRMREMLQTNTKPISESTNIKNLFAVTKYLSVDRMNKRIDFTKGLVVFNTIIEEIAARIQWPVEQVYYLRISEIENFLNQGQLVAKEIITERQSFALLKIEAKELELLTGEKAKMFANVHLVKSDTDGVVQVTGAVGSPGFVRGRVMVIADETDLVTKMEAMQAGDILVTGNTRPDMIAACRKAAAIVTNEGGILSHAALVSREFGIPCVIGTKQATKIFKTGDIVEVDANMGVVRKIKTDL